MANMTVDGSGLPQDGSAPPIAPRTVYLVSATLLSLSVAGALCMILPFLFSPTYRRLRHRLIFGLAISDFVTAMVMLIPSCIALSGARPENDVSCRTAGFLYLTFVISAAFWTLSIAVTTYSLLVHPLSLFTDWLGRPKTVILFGFLFTSVGALVTGIGYARFGFARTGTICGFGANSGQFGKLILLVPRIIVFATVITLYFRLFLFIRKPSENVVVSDFDERLPAEPPENAYSPLKVALSNEGSKTATMTKEQSTDEKQGSLFGGWTWARQSVSESTSIRKDSKDSQATLLPAYSAAGAKISPERPTPSRCWSRPGPPSRQNSGGIAWSTEVDWTNEKPTTDSLPPQSPKTARAARPPPLPVIAPSPIIPSEPSPLTIPETVPSSLSPIPSHDDEVAPLPSPSRPTSPPSSPPTVGRRNSSKRKTPPSSPQLNPLRPPGAKELALSLSRSMSRTRSRVDPPSLGSAPASSPPPRTLRAPTIPSGQAIVAMGDAKRRASERKLSVMATQGKEGEEGELSLEAVLNGAGGSLTGSEEGDGPRGERKRRMSAQEMNRKASILMMLYPVAYMLCFSVSVARLINDLANNRSFGPNEVLSVLSRWFIYASGFIDCLVFLVIEGGVRRFY